MSCDQIGPLLMGYMDDELNAEETETVERHLQSCAKCRLDLTEFRRLDKVTSSLKFVVPEDEIWEGYWSKIYNRLERDVGWILLSSGIGLLVLFGAYRWLREFFSDPSVSVILKVGIGSAIGGVVVLLLSIARERFYFYRHQRYKDVRR